MTIQVMFYSLLLFGSTGLVLDSGQVFSRHSEMQAYADMVALAAAAELDGTSDALLRANDAATGVEGALPLLVKQSPEGVPYEIAGMTFYPEIPDDGISSTTDPAEASYVAVAVREIRYQGVITQIARMMTSTFGEPVSGAPLDGIEIGASAVAGLERVQCAEMSSIALCNPFEDVGSATAGTSTELGLPEDLRGRMMAVFAPNVNRDGFTSDVVTSSPGVDGSVGGSTASIGIAVVEDGRNHGSAYPWDVRNQVFRLVDPDPDSAEVCSADTLASAALGSGGQGLSYLRARERCLTARATAETVCYEDSLQLRHANGPDLAAGINTRFDIWSDPFDVLLSDGAPFRNTELTLAEFFEPDALRSHVYVTHDTDGDGIGEDTAARPGRPGAHQLTAGPGMRPAHGARSLMAAEACLDATLAPGGASAGAPACSLPFVGDYAEGSNPTDIRSRMITHLRAVYDKTGEDDLAVLPDPSITTWYELYLLQRDMIDEYVGNTAVIDAGGAVVPDNTLETEIAVEPTTYFELSGQPDLTFSDYTRRRIRAAMVNCRAAADRASAEPGIGFTATDPDDPTDTLTLVDVYVPEPAGYVCPDGKVGCSADESIETLMLVEMIDEVSTTGFQRYTAQLVR